MKQLLLSLLLFSLSFPAFARDKIPARSTWKKAPVYMVYRPEIEFISIVDYSDSSNLHVLHSERISVPKGIKINVVRHRYLIIEDRAEGNYMINVNGLVEAGKSVGIGFADGRDMTSNGPKFSLQTAEATLTIRGETIQDLIDWYLEEREFALRLKGKFFRTKGPDSNGLYTWLKNDAEDENSVLKIDPRRALLIREDQNEDQSIVANIRRDGWARRGLRIEELAPHSTDTATSLSAMLRP